MHGPEFNFVVADSCLIILPRFLSSLMMHITVETDIRSGLILMKYAVNHPSKFQVVKKNEDEAEIKINTTRVCLAFFLGFCQAAIAIVVEVLVITYLTSQRLLTDVIMKYVSLAAIVKFDNFYFDGLYEEKMKKAAGKILPIEYQRHMGKMTHEEREV